MTITVFDIQKIQRETCVMFLGAFTFFLFFLPLIFFGDKEMRGVGQNPCSPIAVLAFGPSFARAVRAL